VEDPNVPFAPTCEIVDWTCPRCKHVVDLTEYTGISYEEASNAREIEDIISQTLDDYTKLE